MSDIIRVKIADYGIASAPSILVTCGLGSCVGISLYDEVTKTGGLAHIMLPCGGKGTDPKCRPRYADTAVEMMLSEMEEMGCGRDRLVAKLAGGASMFPNLRKAGKGIGDRNVEAVLEILSLLGIPILGADTGGDYGRSIEFDPGTGEMRIKSVTRPVKVI